MNQHAPALLHAPASYPFTPKSAENWALLLARLDPPLDRDGATRLLNQTPPSVWPLLLARGYRIKTDELDQWLASASPAQLRENWSLLKEPLSTQPAGPMASVLKKFLSQERCAWGLGRYYVDENKEGGIEQNDVDKVKFLLEAGVRVAEPLKLDTVCIQRSKPEQYAALLATGTIHPLDTTNAHRFVSEPLHCRIVPSPALFHALSIRSLTGETGEVAIDTVQALEYPNAEDCALLLSGGSVSARLFIDEDSFYGPYRLTPCADPTLSGAVLRVVENDVQMEPMGEGASEGLLPLRDTATGRRYFLARKISGSTCDGGRSAALLGWMTQGDKTTLQALPQDDPAWQALLEQCSLAHADSEESCLGLPPRPNPETATESAKPAWDEIQAVDLFIKTYWSQERQAFLQALLKLDFTQLKAFREQGIPGEWVWAALEAVTAADLPIAVKRQCTAWLFRNPMALSAALKNDVGSEQQLRGLVAWLPSEDWGPMLAALDEGSYLLSVLQEEAEKQHKKRLACRFAKAAHQDCSAIPDAEP